MGKGKGKARTDLDNKMIDLRGQASDAVEHDLVLVLAADLVFLPLCTVRQCRA